MLLPNSDRAFIDPRKLADYSLWPDHPVGGHKAILFQRVLGITVADARSLRDILLHVAPSAEAAIGRLDEFGQRYTIDFTLSTAAGTASIRSGWIVRGVIESGANHQGQRPALSQPGATPQDSVY